MRRRAVLVVEYTPDDANGHQVEPTASKWERVFGGAGVKDLRVEVQEDKAWP